MMAQKAIGPTFPAELAAAGLIGLPFSWDPAGDIIFGAAMTTAQIAAVEAVYAAHNPDAPPPAAQLAAAAYDAWIGAGLTVTSIGTPALAGVYAIDPQTQSDIAVEAQFISTFSEFTNGGTVDLLWPLPNDSEVTFPTTVAFMAFAKGAGQKVAAAKAAIVQGS